MFRNQRTPGRKIAVPAPNSGESTRIPINQTNLSIAAPKVGTNSRKFSMVSPINASQPSSVKSGYLEVHSGGHPGSPSRLYCVLSSNVLRCYSSSPDDTGVLADTAVPTYQFRMNDYALTVTTCGRPQAFALANKKNTHSIEFLCRNIGAMNQWTNILKVR